MNLQDAIAIVEASGGEGFRDTYDKWEESDTAFIFMSSKHSGIGGFGSPFIVDKASKEVSFDYAGYCFSSDYSEPFAHGKLT